MNITIRKKEVSLANCHILNNCTATITEETDEDKNRIIITIQFSLVRIPGIEPSSVFDELERKEAQTQ